MRLFLTATFSSLKTIHFAALIVMAFYSRNFKGVLGYQLKNGTKFGFRNAVTAQRQHLGTETETGVHSIPYTMNLLEHFIEEKPPIATTEVMKILRASIEQHKILPNVVRLKIPEIAGSDVISMSTKIDGTIETGEASDSSNENPLYGSLSVCGDTHGQFHDVMNIFSEGLGGFPSKKNAYLFNGDFVDRGRHSIEVLLSLLAIKLSNPTAMHLLRGNHETISMNKMFGFTAELVRKYPQDYQALFIVFQELFCSLPIAAVIEDQAFVTHGGLGPATSEMTLKELDMLDRFKEPEFDDEIVQVPFLPGKKESTPAVPEFCPGGMAELLWSDPSETIPGFGQSQRGGGSTTFGAHVTMQFLDRNNLKVIIRSHQVMAQGFEVGHNGRCVTVFSAPNYCGGKNLGALMRFNDPDGMMAPSVITFGSVDKPVAKRFV